ncbi:anaerobic carbon-monoxide dehydrogenase catalytic subunit [Carboxydothermus pertinax]|uniref:Carbon monoxide dehydrogenase n=1 Tax=Carboxydothermus pertinax TaxID=870242 RepID=A0A1L8CW80_9THEO|nr:anaerobic carbon-monoxide dehydrogenase catalytic subunit [Carboxydothermus pertinax]GAV23153.1 carbon-monoxide dehydrogenase catalytic subunit [Carboxydothermus pertinax]
MATKTSIHPSVNELYQRLAEDQLSNCFDRFDPQEKIRCNYCELGVSCQLCSNGPCRINEKVGATLGVCGINADGMAMRYMLLRNVMGTSTYTYHAYEAYKTLKMTALGNTPFTITDKDKLYQMAKDLELNTEGKPEDVAVRLSDFLIWELYRDYDEPGKMIEVYAPLKRKEVWRKLGIYPAGPLHELKDAAASCLTNVDGDYVSLATKGLRLGLSCIYGAQIGLELVQDILFGTGMPHEMDVDLGIFDADYINIVFNGHEPFVGVALILAAKEAVNQDKAKAAGAKGLRIYGSIESGQEVVQRFQKDEVFRGLTGNWLTIEPMLATGAVDVLAMDMNCSPPNLGPLAEKYGATLVSVSRLVRFPGIHHFLDYKPSEVREIAQKIIDIAVDSFKNKRHGKITPKIPANIQKAITGFTPEAILKALGGSINPLIEVIKAGKIKGAVGLINCTTLKNGPQDYVTVNLAKELIKRDILILSGGCGNHALEVAGLCNLDAINLAGPGLSEVCRNLNIPPVLSFGTCTDTGRISLVVTALANALNVDTADLPVAVTAPMYMEQKATIDALFALAYGLYTHVAPDPPVMGAPNLVKLLTRDLPSITGGRIAVGSDPVKVADDILAHINDRRAKLGI